MTHTIRAILKALLLTTIAACGANSGSKDGPVCTHQCSADSDCLVNGDNVGLTCVDSLCAASAAVTCTDNSKCIALFSGWSTPCTADGGQCEANEQVCVLVDGGGRCATPAATGECGHHLLQVFEATNIHGKPAKVCANTLAECGATGQCFARCQADTDCLSAPAPICNVDTGLCECGQDSDCAHFDRPDRATCNAGVCGCGSDQDCVAGGAGDLCDAGVCTCTSNQACMSTAHRFDGGAVRCVSI
jgi:hypothetical protein